MRAHARLPCALALAFANATCASAGDTTAPPEPCALGHALARAVERTAAPGMRVVAGDAEGVVEVRGPRGVVGAFTLVVDDGPCNAPRTEIEGFGPGGSGFTEHACVHGRAVRLSVLEVSRTAEAGDPPASDAVLAALAEEPARCFSRK